MTLAAIPLAKAARRVVRNPAVNKVAVSKAALKEVAVQAVLRVQAPARKAADRSACRHQGAVYPMQVCQALASRVPAPGVRRAAAINPAVAAPMVADPPALRAMKVFFAARAAAAVRLADPRAVRPVALRVVRAVLQTVVAALKAAQRVVHLAAKRVVVLQAAQALPDQQVKVALRARRDPQVACLAAMVRVAKAERARAVVLGQ